MYLAYVEWSYGEVCGMFLIQQCYTDISIKLLNILIIQPILLTFTLSDTIG